jgi:uncharacterized protein YbjT (DUF2867 family)
MNVSLESPAVQGEDSKPRVLVFGASGYVGTWLIPRLLDEPVRIRAVSRNERVLRARNWQGLELGEADALQPDSLPAVFEGVDTAYYLVHSMSAGSGFGDLDIDAARHFAAAAERAQVRRIVYLGGLVPEGADSEHIRSRAETGDQLRQGRVPVTELRAGIIIGPGSAAFEVMRDLVLHLPVMTTPRWVRAKSPPIALDNLLEYLVRLAFLDRAAGCVLDVGGPEQVTYEYMMRALADAAGKRAPLIIPVPVLTPRLSSYWLGLVTAVPTPVARALIGGLKHDFEADDREARELVPQRLLTVREAIEAAFAAEREHRVVGRWSEGAFSLRDRSHDVAYYAKKAGGEAHSTAPPSALWTQLAAIGGRNRYYFANWLWTLREFIDWCVGGPGLSRGRRDSDSLRLGDTVDSWTVLGAEEPKRLTLKLGMKAPGSGILEFEIVPESNGSIIRATAYWHPKGFWGLAYWYALVPAHLFLFRGWTRAIARRAEAAEAPGRSTVDGGDR